MYIYIYIQDCIKSSQSFYGCCLLYTVSMIGMRAMVFMRKLSYVDTTFRTKAVAGMACDLIRIDC